MISDERKQLIGSFNEVTSYFFIDASGAFMFRLNHDAAHGRIQVTPEFQQSMSDIREEQEYCISTLGRFGIDPESAKNRPYGDYWKWYEHWHNWQHGMSNEEWKIVDQRITAEEDFSELLPKHKWNEIPII